MASNRTRNYATIVYPESAPENWQEILSDQFVPAFISPIHDIDISPNGEPKKPHFHVIIMFDSVKTIDQAVSVFQKINGCGCEVVQSLRGYARYLCHLDHADKVQYDPQNVKALCGADYVATIGLVLDKYKAIGEMIDYCIDQNIVSYSDLLEYSRRERFDWFRVLCDNGTVVINVYLKSRQWTNSIRTPGR